MATLHEPRVVCFVSYDHDDQDFVDFLEGMLSLYQDKVELLRDRNDIDRRSALDTALRAMISRCDVFLPIVSPAYVQSEWCQREHAWLEELRPDAAVVPLRLGTEVDAFSNHLGVLFGAWRVNGDRTVRETLIPTLTRGEGAPAVVTLDLGHAEALRLARDFQVLGSAVNRVDLRAPADEAFTQIGVRLMQLPSMPARGRAWIAAAIAGQQVQRGRWGALHQWASTALAQVEIDGAKDDTRTDEELAFIGERYTELALADRRLGSSASAAAHYQSAADRYTAIRDALLQRVRRAQVCREQGTLATARLHLGEARQRYAESRALLIGVPSERMHLAQAWIKEAQVELVAGRDADVDRCLMAAAGIVDRGEPEVGEAVSELTARVAAHYWKTRAWTALGRGQPGALARATAAHASVIAGYPWHNEEAQQRTLRRLAVVAAVVPVFVMRQVARAAIVGEAGLLARALRPLHARTSRLL